MKTRLCVWMGTLLIVIATLTAVERGNRPQEPLHGEEDTIKEILDCQEEDSFEKVPKVKNQTPIKESRQGNGQDCVPENLQSTRSGK